MRRLSVEELVALVGRAGGSGAESSDNGPPRLAEDVALPAPLPQQPVARRAGRAVSSADLLGASATSPVMLTGPLLRVRIGDPMPAGADAVIDPDLIQAVGPAAMATGEAEPGEGVRQAGTDVPPAGYLVPAGSVLDARLAAVLASVGRLSGAFGCARLDASDRALPDPAVLAAAGALFGRIALPSGLRVTLSSDPDAEPVFGDERVLADGLALRPGDQTIAMEGGDGVRLILPATLDSVVAVAAMLTAFGVVGLEGGVLARKVASRVGIAEIALLRRDGEAFQVLATGDWPLWAIAAATHMLLVPPASEGYPPGTAVQALPIGAWARG
ncbi:hypothetical protein [Chthonobacter albigriseus]|uniref:hypothetical protein n=1 Tax=Chthonobacter albigriseus TaxID=1683161 RepID=UPI0015EF2F52|nr:hypothetical protein [Chthonobacter albigriseus]